MFSSDVHCHTMLDPALIVWLSAIAFVLTPNIVPLSMFSSDVHCHTMLDPALIVRLSGRPSREVQWLSLVIPNPGPVVEDVRQTDPEPVDRSIVAHQSLSFQLADESFLFFPRANLDQMSTALFTFPF